MKNLLKALCLAGALAGCTPYVPVIPDDPDIVEEVRDDFNINLNLESYVVGDAFDFTGQIQNKSLDEIVVDNLEYNLTKGSESVLTESFDGFVLTMYPQGFLETIYQDNKFKTKFWGINYDDGTNKFDVPTSCPFPFSISTDYNSYIFKEEGSYILEVKMTYTVNNEAFDLSFNKQIEVAK